MHKPALVALLLAAVEAAVDDDVPVPVPAVARLRWASRRGPASTNVSTTSQGTSTMGPGEDSAGSGSAANSSTGILRDVGTDDDFGPTQPVGCKGKVDLLFLISSFGTMDTEQKQLLASFPDFVATIQEKLADFDVHIMAANPIGKWVGWPCEEGCNDDPQNCAEYGYQCNAYPKLVTPCDYTLGAGLTFNAGATPSCGATCGAWACSCRN